MRRWHGWQSFGRKKLLTSLSRSLDHVHGDAVVRDGEFFRMQDVVGITPLRFGQNPQPDIRVSYEDQQSGAYCTSHGGLCTRYHTATTGSLHYARNTCDGFIAGRARSINKEIGIITE